MDLSVAEPGKSELEKLWGRSGQNNPELETEIGAAYSSGQLGEHLAQDRGWWAQRPDFGLL